MNISYFDGTEVKISNETFEKIKNIEENIDCEKESLRQFYENIDKNKNGVIVDIGAQIGLYSLYAKNLKNYIFYSYEPYEESFNLLKDNILLNEILNVNVINRGISDKWEKKKLKVCKNHTGLNTLGENLLRFSKDESEEIEIQVSSLDDEFYYTDTDISYIKIDTEGWEYNILRGGVNIINKCKPDIQLEWNVTNMNQCGVNENDLKSLLFDMGYVLVSKKNEEILFKHISKFKLIN